MTKTYEVPIVYKGKCNYIVEASSEQEAEEIARSLWGNGKAPTELGNEWEEIDRIGEIVQIEKDDCDIPYDVVYLPSGREE